MASDSDLWWNKYYEGNTKKFLDDLLIQNNPQNTKNLEINQRQIYDRLPSHLKWNQESERLGSSNAGAVLEHFMPISSSSIQSYNITDFSSVSSPARDIISDIIQKFPHDYNIPDWFYNKIELIKNNSISEIEFLNSFRQLGYSTDWLEWRKQVTPSQIISTITEPTITTSLPTEETYCIDVYRLSNGNVTASKESVNISTYSDYINNQQLFVVPCNQAIPSTQEVQNHYRDFPSIEPQQPQETWSGWVKKPSGKIEQITLTISTMQRLINEGWIFTTEQPVTPQPENENISVIFYTGTGGDLKTHFNINSIIVTPDEKIQLAQWLQQNYNTSVILAVNRLTNDVRTHTVQQIKALIIQKIQDDTQQPVLPIQPAINGKTGLMGAGVAGLMGLLILGGFLADSRRKK